MTQREEFRAYMKAANHPPGNDDGRHLSEPQMMAYCRGEMSAAERESAQTHLVGCEQCIALFRSARDFLEPARPDEEEVTAADINEAWQSLVPRMRTTASATVGGAGTNVARVDFQRLREKRFLLDSRVTFALAATVLISLGSVGLLTWRIGRASCRERVYVLV